AVSSLGVCDDGLLELALFFGVRFSMNTTISTSNNMSMAWISIEFLLMFVIGAVVFRLTWAFTQKKLPCWSSVLILVAIILLLVPGHIDETLIVEFGGKTPPKHLLSPLAVNLLRCVGVLLGAWLATTVIGKRKKIGLEDKPPYDDFP
ncbi:hypothetical protein, partial [Thiolapillus sp.]|uniref:hypothetical protein n=4 Tax=Thiolapillus sp. TaxID=2017437 RepID=UPI0025F4482D